MSVFKQHKDESEAVLSAEDTSTEQMTHAHAEHVSAAR